MQGYSTITPWREAMTPGSQQANVDGPATMKPTRAQRPDGRNAHAYKERGAC